MKLSKKEESDICLSCGECCRRYLITVLKEEASLIARTLKKSNKRFLEEDTQLSVKLFAKSVDGVLTFPTTFFPKRIGQMIEENVKPVPQSFFVLPQVVLKKEHGCTFLNEDNTCKIYSARPAPCRLFPFIAVEGIRESYPFCLLFKKTNKDYSKQSRSYFKKVKNYFAEVDKKGFTKYWKNPPKKGLLYLHDTFIGEINLKELEEMMQVKH